MRKFSVLHSINVMLLCLFAFTGTQQINAQSQGCYKAISAGSYHTLAIKTDGSLWAWGYNLYGQLGDGTNADKTAPVQIGTATNWASVSAGIYHSIATQTNGSLWAWGSNDYGQLGDGSNTSRTSPVQIGTATNWTSISARAIHTIATQTDGSLWAWGWNYYGQLGDGTNDDETSPVQIGTATNWASIGAGSSHTIATQTNGSLWAWGNNEQGQLGDGTTIDKNSPLQISTCGVACNPTASTFTVSACGTYTWVAKGNTVYTASNTTDTIMLTNAAGCDSVVTLNLTINAAPATPSVNVTPITCTQPTGSIRVNTVAGITYSIDGTTFGRTTWTNLSPGAYTITAKNAAGCTNTTTANIVRSINSPNDYAVGGGGSYCKGGTGVSITLSGSSGGYISYQLEKSGIAIGSPQIGTGRALVFSNVTADGVYFIKATDIKRGCFIYMTGTALVTTLASPTTYTVRGGGGYCGSGTGPSVTLTGSQTTVTYQLYRNGTATGTFIPGTGSALAFTNITAAGVYTVEATNSSSNCTRMMSRSATVNTDVPAAPQGSVTTQTSCMAAKGTITVTPLASGLSYSIDGTNYTTAVKFNNLNPGTYPLYAKNFGGCVTASAATFTINPIPPSLTKYDVTGGGSFCAKGTGVEVGLSNSDNGVSYQLQHSSTNISGPVAGTGGPLSFGLQTADDFYYVIASQSGSCNTTMNGNARVIVIPAPTAPAATGNRICGAGSMTLNATPFNFENIDWFATATGGTALAAGNNFTTPTLTATTKYYAQASDQKAGCASKRTLVNAVVQYKTPTVSAITGSTSLNCFNNPQTLTYSVANSTGVAYNWTAPANTTIISGQGTNSIQLQFNTSFNGGALSVTNSNACGQGTTQTVNIICYVTFSRMTQPQQPLIAAEAIAYPNPSKGAFSVQLKGYKAQKLQLTMLSANGQVLQTRSIEASTASQNVPFNLSKMAAGLYFIKVQSCEGVKMVKVVKE